MDVIQKYKVSGVIYLFAHKSRKTPINIIKEREDIGESQPRKFPVMAFYFEIKINMALYDKTGDEWSPP